MICKFCRISVVIYLFGFILFSGCETGKRDYYYVVQNMADNTGRVQLTYSLNGVMENQSKWLEPNESFEIYARKEVSGDDIWNIETSSLLYAVPAIVATNRDSVKKTEELSLRSYWSPQPENRDGNGVYLLKITDDMFVLEKQEYKYLIHNATDDSLFITSSLLGDARKRDTIVAKDTISIGQVKIFSYNETLQGTAKYIEKKLSGISSLTVTYKGILKNIDFKKYKSLNLQPCQQQCILVVDRAVFD